MAIKDILLPLVGESGAAAIAAIEKCTAVAGDIPANLAVWARLKDLSLVPVKPHDDQSEKIVERLIFESGRPILMCPEEFAGELAVAFDQVVIAWDHTA